MYAQCQIYARALGAILYKNFFIIINLPCKLSSWGKLLLTVDYRQLQYRGRATVSRHIKIGLGSGLIPKLGVVV